MNQLEQVRHPDWIKERIKVLQELSVQLGQRSLNLMEVCGTHTMSVFRSGIRPLLPANIHLISGPGCPVCVTPTSYIDAAMELSKQTNVIITTFGDLMKVPGRESNLNREKAGGAQIKVVYSPLDALALARQNPASEVIFIGVGFETTAPGIAATIKEAYQNKITNYSVICAHKTMPQAMRTIVETNELKIDGFLCPGHVSTITGTKIYDFLAEEFKIPCVVTGFEAGDILEGIEMLTRQAVQGKAFVENQYQRSVNQDGNKKAQALLNEVFQPDDTEWRGFGVIPGSGLRIRDKYAAHDALKKFNQTLPESTPIAGCLCGEVLRGVKIPTDCKLFRTVCSPENPVGACMVSNEGTCAAYYKYGNQT